MKGRGSSTRISDLGYEENTISTMTFTNSELLPRIHRHQFNIPHMQYDVA